MSQRSEQRLASNTKLQISTETHDSIPRGSCPIVPCCKLVAGSALSAVECRWLELDDWGIGYFKATKSRTCSTFNLCYLIMLRVVPRLHRHCTFYWTMMRDKIVRGEVFDSLAKLGIFYVMLRFLDDTMQICTYLVLISMKVIKSLSSISDV